MTGQMTGRRSILTVDAGNTAVKVAVFQDEHMVHSVTGKVNASEAIDAVLTYNSVDGICYCCVGQDDPDLAAYLAASGLPFVRLDADTPVPIAVEYGSRATLGVDRLAARGRSVGGGGGPCGRCGNCRDERSCGGPQVWSGVISPPVFV